MESYEYNEVIEKMTEQIQFLTIELACALYDLSGYMGDWQREEIRKLRTEDYLLSITRLVYPTKRFSDNQPTQCSDLWVLHKECLPTFNV